MTKAPKDVIFVSSDFTRAKETAENCVAELEKQLDDHTFNIDIRTELRERFFGAYDAKVLIFYNRVWTIDTVSLHVEPSYPYP